jgi:twinkle protein
MTSASAGNASIADGQILKVVHQNPMQGVLAFLRRRGISEEAATRFSIGIAEHPELGRCMTFPYFLNGNLTATKLRNQHKQFSQKGSCAVTFFNSECLSDKALDGLPLIVAEGEIDLLTVIECGFDRAIGFGAGAPPKVTNWPIPDEDDKRYSAIYNHKTELERADKIILLTDADEAGRFLNIDLRRRFGEYRCWSVKYPDGCKDINDVLLRHGKQACIDVINQAFPSPIPNVKKLADYPELLPPETYDTGWPWADQNLQLFKPELMIVTGVPSHGKSTLTNALCLNLAYKHHFKIGMSSLEMPPVPYFRDGARRYLTQAFNMTVFQADKFINDHISFIDPDESMDVDPTLDWFLDRLNMAWLREGLDMFVLDPWNELSHDWRKSGYGSFTEYVGEAIKEIKRFIRRRNMIGCVVAHPSKMNDKGKINKPTLYDISDSSHFYNKADHGIVVWRVNNSGDIDLDVQKSRFSVFGGKPGIVKFRMENYGRFVERIDEDGDDVDEYRG